MLRSIAVSRFASTRIIRHYSAEAGSSALLARLKDDRKTFMRTKAQPELNVVKNILSDYTYHIKSPNFKPEQQSEDAAVVSVIQKLVKKRQDAISQYEAGGRPELAAKEKEEMSVLQRYLPAQLSAEEIESEVKRIIAEVGATSLKDMGKVMKAWSHESADKKAVSDAVKKLLA
ncbi:Yqey-like protein-domain-containing protein [Dichotomocladium elegans]|nr:Yqey-like protein-domain-containing protein [Dichotomocladium elegans]